MFLIALAGGQWSVVIKTVQIPLTSSKKSARKVGMFNVPQPALRPRHSSLSTHSTRNQTEECFNNNNYNNNKIYIAHFHLAQWRFTTKRRNRKVNLTYQ